MASLRDFKISPCMPSDVMDFFLPIADNRLFIMFILMVKGLPDSLD